MKNVMILSAGTSTAWHIVKVLKENFSDDAYVVACDINPGYLIHSAVLADKFIQVPPIKSEGYYEHMLKIMDEEAINIVVPLIDDDICMFAGDNMDLAERGVRSSAPSRAAIDKCSNKAHLERTLSELGVATPRVFRKGEEIDMQRQYFLKDEIGCGSRGARLVFGEEAMQMLGVDGKVIQEVCHGPEITVDATNLNGCIHCICRERKEVKLGVSTKCRVFYDEEIQRIMERIAAKITLPTVFCVQFMKNAEEKWTLIDFNLRSGGGTALSCAVGFEAVRYAAADWLGLEPDETWLSIPKTERYVVRAYEELVTR